MRTLEPDTHRGLLGVHFPHRSHGLPPHQLPPFQVCSLLPLLQGRRGLICLRLLKAAVERIGQRPKLVDLRHGLPGIGRKFRQTKRDPQNAPKRGPDGPVGGHVHVSSLVTSPVGSVDRWRRCSGQRRWVGFEEEDGLTNVFMMDVKCLSQEIPKPWVGSLPDFNTHITLSPRKPFAPPGVGCFRSPL